MKRLTVSEAAFETFLADHGLDHERLLEADTPRPDYLVRIAAVNLIFEIKELSKRRCSSARSSDSPRFCSSTTISTRCTCSALKTTTSSKRCTALGLWRSRESGRVADAFHSRDQAVAVGKNTSFSAIGRLAPRAGRMMVTVFENAFAKVKLPHESLPTCLDVRRVEIELAKPR